MPGYERNDVGADIFLYLALTDSTEFERLVQNDALNHTGSVVTAENAALSRLFID
jgi:hypothetical protein